MSKSASQKRREAKAKRNKKAAQKREKLAATITPLAQRGDKNEANKHADHTTNQETATKGRSVSGFILILSSVAFTVFLFIVGMYWQRRDYASIRTAFWWLIPTCGALVVVALSAYWYYVVKPSNAISAGEPTNRANVWVTNIEMFKPLQPNQPVVLQLEFTNKGNSDAELSGVWKAVVTAESTLPDDYAGTLAMQPFHLPPNTKKLIVFTPPGITPTAEDIKGIESERLSLVFWGRFQYETLGQVYLIPYCSAYVAPYGGFYDCGRKKQ